MFDEPEFRVIDRTALRPTYSKASGKKEANWKQGCWRTVQRADGLHLVRQAKALDGTVTSIDEGPFADEAAASRFLTREV